MGQTPDNQEEERDFLNRVDFGDGTSTDDFKEEEVAAEESSPKPEKAESALSDLEIRARNEGWRPREEFKGHPDKWVDAETFLRRGEEVLPLVKARLTKAEQEVKTTKQSLEAWQKYHLEDRKRVEQRAYERALADIKARAKEAVSQADGEAYEQTEMDRERLEKSHQEEMRAVEAAVPPPPQEYPEHYYRWISENPWYQTDGTALRTPMNSMTQYAQGVSGVILAENPQWKGSEMEFFQAVSAEVKRRYPEKFRNAMRDAPSLVEASSERRSPGSAKRKTFADLPQEAKDECQRMKRAGMKEADFINEYFGQAPYTISD